MNGYGVHLLFHLVAIVIGTACGVAAGLWWFGLGPAWVFVTAVVVGMLLLLLQALYIQSSGPKQTRDLRARPSRAASSYERTGGASRSTPGTRRDLPRHATTPPTRRV